MEQDIFHTCINNWIAKKYNEIYNFDCTGRTIMASIRSDP